MTTTSVVREKSTSGSSLSSLTDATVQSYCRALRLPTVRTQFERLAHDALRANQSHTSYLGRSGRTGTACH